MLCADVEYYMTALFARYGTTYLSVYWRQYENTAQKLKKNKESEKNYLCRGLIEYNIVGATEAEKSRKYEQLL